MINTGSFKRSNPVQQTIHSPAVDSLELLVLQSGDRAIHNMASVFRRQLHESELQLFSGSKKQIVKKEYRQYEQKVCKHLAPDWHGSGRSLKKQIRRSLKIFRKSTGMLHSLLATPARITASACLMALLGSGHQVEASMSKNNSTDIQQLLSPLAVKQKALHREVVFVDAALPNLDLLLQGTPEGASIVPLQSSTDLIGQILDHLLHSGPVESLHLLTHAAPGQLRLGDAVIDQTTLKKQAKQLELLGTLLTGSRDIYLYGCQLATGRKGSDFVHLLSALTHADVAASDDFTGTSSKGGDWELELVAGKVGNRAITSPNYGALLPYLGTPGAVIAGDGGGGGGGGADYGAGGAGGDGGGDNDTVTGTNGDDILFGDGSGGGGGGSYYASGGTGGNGGGGDDTLYGGLGDDILFGDGFDGEDAFAAGGLGGFGGGGGGGFGSDSIGVGGNGVSGTDIGGIGTTGGSSPATLEDNSPQTIYSYVKGVVLSLASFPGGAGNDTLDGGPGSDSLFGMGGTNTFVFETDDASPGGVDKDQIYDWGNGTSNKIELKTGGSTLSKEEVLAIIAAQTAEVDDRSIIHVDGLNQVVIDVRDIGRDLEPSDFIVKDEFPWAMFLPAIVSPKK